MTDHDAHGFNVLFVCTGNVCRSPVAELVTRRLLVDKFGPEEAARFAVSSAGTNAVLGEPMDPLSRAELADAGLDGDEATDFRSRPVTVEAIEAADLILTADRTHRSAVVQLAPSALARPSASASSPGCCRLSTWLTCPMIPSLGPERQWSQSALVVV